MEVGKMTTKTDCPAYEWAKNNVSVDPDIFFDDEPEDTDRVASNSLTGARLIISTLIAASDGNMLKLQALMCVFAGMTLREVAEVCGKSHEYVRLQIKSVESTHPELYSVLVDTRYRYKVPSLVPVGAEKWTIRNKASNRTVYSGNLRDWCRDKGYPYHKVRYRVDKADGVYRAEDGLTFTITRNY